MKRWILKSRSFGTRTSLRSSPACLSSHTLSLNKDRKEEWDKIETKAMEEVVGLYGKLYHFWEVDKGHQLPRAVRS